MIKSDVSSYARNVRFGLLITAFGGFLFTFDLPLLRLADNEKWTLVFARGMLLFLSITVVWLVMRMRSSQQLPYVAGAAGIAVIATNTVANITYIGALKETGAANVVFILALVPVLTAVFSRIFIKEEVRPFTWTATVLALIGVGIIVRDSLSIGGLWGDFLAFVCACCTAAAFTIIRASGKQHLPGHDMGAVRLVKHRRVAPLQIHLARDDIPDLIVPQMPRLREIIFAALLAKCGHTKRGVNLHRLPRGVMSAVAVILLQICRIKLRNLNHALPSMRERPLTAGFANANGHSPRSTRTASSAAICRTRA